MNIQDWSPLGWTGWMSLQSEGLSRVFSNTTVQKHQFFGAQLSSQSNSTGKTIALTRQTFVGKVISLLLNMLSRLVITFLPRSKRLFFFNFMAAITILFLVSFNLAVAISFSKGSSPLRDQTGVSHTGGRFFPV